MNTSIAQFDQSAIDSAIVEYMPAHVSVEGKTSSDKRLSVLKKADASVVSYAATLSGKVGKAAREGMSTASVKMVANAASRGNYTPLAQLLSLISAEPISISNRASYESLVDRYQPMLDQLETNGKMYSASGKLSAKAAMLTNLIQTVQSVQVEAARCVAERQAAKQQQAAMDGEWEHTEELAALIHGK